MEASWPLHSGGLGGSISVIDVNGGRVRVVARGDYRQRPKWSPDGRRIAFTDKASKDGDESVAVISSTGGRVRRLARGRSATWSPDGRTLAFSDWSNRGPTLRVVNTQGTPRPRTLLKALAGFEWITTNEWSSDGRWILLAYADSSRSAVYVVRADGKALRRIAAGRDPAWSPDGKKIAFSAPGNCGRRAMIHIVDANGRNRRQITRCT
jgi:Tol biopolymer transport system component